MRRLADVTRSPAVRVFAFASALTLLSAWTLVRHLSSAMPADLGDPILETWILWWNAHAVPFTANWWNAPMFYPFQGAFALAEALLAFTPLTTPLQWLGVNPVATHNIVYLLSGPMAAVAAFMLARRLTGRSDAALIAALAFGFSPYRIGQLSHMQVLWSCWMPLALVALHDYIDQRRTRALVWFGVCWMMNGLTNGYFLVYFPILIALWVLWFVRSVRDLVAIGAAAALATLPILPMLLGYASRQRAMGFGREIGEIRDFSADVTAIFAASPRAWVSTYWTLPPRPEGELYPGLAIMALALAGLLIGLGLFRARRRTGTALPAARRRVSVRGVVFTLAGAAAVMAVAVMLSGGTDFALGPIEISMHRPSRLFTVAFWLAFGAFVTSPTVKRAWSMRSVLAFYTLGTAVMFFFALGPEPHAFGTQILYKPPYAWLMYLPGFDSVRVPARFGLLMIVCLAQAGALAYARLFPEMRSRLVSTKKRVPIFFSVLALAILAEGWIPLPVAVLPAQLRPPARAIAANAVIMELPIDMEFEPNTLALYHAIEHRRPMINGFSGYMPGHYHALGLALKDGDATALNAIRTVGTIAAFVETARDKNGIVGALVAAAPGAEVIERDGRGIWYLLPQMTAPVEPASAGQALKLAGVTATSFPAEAWQMTDGRTATRWHGALHGEEQEDTVTVSFDTPVSIDLIEIAQGRFAGTYPRDLEIVLVTDTGNVSVFRGATGGLAVQSALRSREVAMKIAIPPAAPARAVRLISHPKGAKFSWSVGEVRVYGK